MTELPLIRMTSQAHGVGIILEQCHLVVAMHGMTLVAIIKCDGMNKISVLVTLESIIMTISAKQYLATLQQLFSVAGMGTMAVCAAISFVLG